MLEIPLIVAPAIDADPKAPLRTPDLYHLLGRIAGFTSEREGVLDDDGAIRKRPGRKKKKKGRRKDKDDEGPQIDVEEAESPVEG